MIHMPPESRLDMPVQSLTACTAPERSHRPSADVYLARIFVFGLTALLTSAGTYGVYAVISPVNVAWLQLFFAAVFGMTFP